MKFLDSPERIRRRKHPAPALGERELRTAWQCVSLLLEYPTQELIELLPAIRSAAADLPGGVREPLLRFAAHLAGSDLGELQREYVATFDTTRRCALHLTYYTFGDTRKRGIALVQFKQAFRRGGLEVNDEELPDHLSVVCEFGATGDVDIAWKLLNDYRVGIELLYLALEDRKSAWVDAVTTCARPFRNLTAQPLRRSSGCCRGPPNEDVGLDTFALDPRLNPHPDDDVAALQGALS